MSYRRKHIKSKVHKIKPKKSIFKRPWFWIILLFLIVVSSAFYFLLFYFGIQVKNIIILGNQKVASQDIENLISGDINNKILGWIDSKSIFLINCEKLNKEISNNFPIIENVKIDKKLPRTLILNIAERKQVGVYCKNDNQCFLIDENGIIFEQSLASPDNLTIMQASENSQASIGQTAVAKNIIDLILKVEKSLKDNFQTNIKTAVIASLERLNIETNENWQIYFDLSPDSDVNSQLTKLNLLLSNGISADDRKNLRYIDLRPKDRAVVCDNMECGSPR